MEVVPVSSRTVSPSSICRTAAWAILRLASRFWTCFWLESSSKPVLVLTIAPPWVRMIRRRFSRSRRSLRIVALDTPK